MGERAQKVVIRSERAIAYTDHWGAHTCFHQLFDGPNKVLCEIAQVIEDDKDEQSLHDRIVWYDPCYIEGGYLVDFDRCHMLLYSWDKQALQEGLRRVQQAWPDWSIEVVDDAPDDFLKYLDTRGIEKP
ncbi:MAG: hypothetical protein ACKVT0_09530 [Planctomycetaceae bacterium]